MVDGTPYSPAINNLRNYHALGLRICGIAYNVANSFGGGVLEPRIGLTLNGRELVEQIHKLKIVLDVGGHTGEQTSLDAIAMSSGVPVICSHTNMLTLVNNPRNTSDRLIEAIARTGGVVGVTAFNDFHIRTGNDTSRPTFPQVSLDKHLDQYDHLKKLVGVDHIGLAPDFLAGRNGVFAAPEGASNPLPRLNENGSVNSLSPQAYSTWPWNEGAYVDGFDSIDKLPNVLRGLAQRGWTSEEIRKVMGGNWLRVYRQVWGA
jgi:membrane dipeptidase